MNALSCVTNNDLRHLKMVCERRKDLEVVDDYGNTALLKSCYLGQWQAVRMLLQAGANFKAINNLGQNALSLAAYSGHFEIINELLRYASYKDYNRDTSVPPIFVAILRKNWAVYNYFKQLDGLHCVRPKTLHGLYASQLLSFVNQGSVNAANHCHCHHH